MAAEEQKKIGAPVKYNTTFNKQVEKLCLLGAVDKDIASFFEIHIDTVYDWKNKYPAFSEAIKRGKDMADMEVASRLYARAKGYQFKEVTKERGSKGKLVITKEVTKEVPPETAAACFWLKNRQKKKWRDKHEVGNTDSDGNDVPQGPPLTFDQLMQLKYGPSTESPSTEDEDRD